MELFESEFIHLLDPFLATATLKLSNIVYDHVCDINDQHNQKEDQEVSSKLKLKFLIENKVCEAKNIVREHNNYDVVCRFHSEFTFSYVWIYPNVCSRKEHLEGQEKHCLKVWVAVENNRIHDKDESSRNE